MAVIRIRVQYADYEPSMTNQRLVIPAEAGIHAASTSLVCVNEARIPVFTMDPGLRRDDDEASGNNGVARISIPTTTTRRSNQKTETSAHHRASQLARR